jgi:type IV pilus assembly protein PilM
VSGRAAVGLDIGTTAVRGAEVTVGRGATTLERFGQVALPDGAVRHGEIADPAAVAQALKMLWSRAKFRSKKVAVGVSNAKVIVRQVDFPWAPLEELRKSLAFQAQDFVPMPLEQAVLDMHPLEEVRTDDGGRLMRVLLVAAAKDMVNASIEAVRLAGLDPVSVDLTSFAVLRALVSPASVGASDAPVEAVIDVGAAVTNIVVHQGGMPRFVRILLMGGHQITDAVSERLGIPPEQAEQLKAQLGAPAQQAVQVADHPAVRVLDQATSVFVDEVRGSLDYYHASTQSAPIARIVLSGGGAALPGLGERIANATRLPVHPAAPSSGMRTGKTGLTPDQLAAVDHVLTVPVGLALGVAS